MSVFLKKINNLKLVTKIILIISLTCLVVLIGEIGSRNIVYEAYNEQIYLRTVQLLTSYVSHMETELDKVDNLTLTMIGDSSLQKNLVSLKEKGAADRYNITRNVKAQLSSYKGMTEYCDVLALRLPSGESLWEFKELTEEQIGEFVAIAREAKGSMVIVPEEGYVWVLRQIRQIENLSMEELGTIFYKLNLEDLMADINRNYEKANVVPELSIYDGSKCLYASVLLQDELLQESDLQGWSLRDEQFVVHAYSKTLDWTFYVSTSYSKINEAVQSADYRSIVMTTMIAAGALLMCSIVMRYIIKHINVLLRKFSDFRVGILPDASVSLKYKDRTDEIGRLHNQFDEMAFGYKKITDEHYNNMLLLKDAQFSQLQGQIRPHFLFNALSTIVWNAYENGDEETAKMADALGEILRHSIHRDEKITTVQEELKILEDYIYIQKIRYRERVSVEINLPEELYEVNLPPFTLQPIVENIFIHVVEKTLEPCHIRIGGTREKGLVEIYIEDSGNRLSENTLYKLERGEIHTKGNGVGLQNINSRIKLLYSDKYGLKITNINGYSRVIVQIPEGEENDKSNVSR